MTLSYFNTRSLFIGIGLSYFFNISAGEIFIPFLISTIMGIITIYFYEHVTIKKVYAFILTIFIGVILINLSHTLYLDKTSIFVLTLFTYLCAYIIGSSSSYSLNKTSFYLFIPCICLTILEFLLLLPSFSFENINILKPFNLKNTSYSSIYLYIVSISPLLVIDDKNKRDLIIGYSLAMFTEFLTGLFIIGCLGHLESLLFRYPEYIVLKLIHFSNFFTNVENIFFFTILVDLIISLSTCINSFKDGKERNILSIISFIITYLFCLRASILSIVYSYMHIVLLILFVLTIIKKLYQKDTVK